MKRQKNNKLFCAALLLAVVATTVILVPSAEARPRRAANGCWVRIWKDHHHRGWYELIRGPRKLPNMKLSKRYWGNRITGLATGPRTWVKVFRGRGMRGGVLIIPPNTSYGSLENVGFNDEIDSMIIQNHPFR